MSILSTGFLTINPSTGDMTMKIAKQLSLQFDYTYGDEGIGVVQINVGLDGFKHYGYFKVSIEDAEQHLKYLQRAIDCAKGISPSKYDPEWAGRQLEPGKGIARPLLS